MVSVVTAPAYALPDLSSGIYISPPNERCGPAAHNNHRAGRRRARWHAPNTPRSNDERTIGAVQRGANQIAAGPVFDDRKMLAPPLADSRTGCVSTNVATMEARRVQKNTRNHRNAGSRIHATDQTSECEVQRALVSNATVLHRVRVLELLALEDEAHLRARHALPLLWRGRKFHVRALVLAVGRLDVYLFEESRVLVATQPFAGASPGALSAPTSCWGARTCLGIPWGALGCLGCVLRMF